MAKIKNEWDFDKYYDALNNEMGGRVVFSDQDKALAKTNQNFATAIGSAKKSYLTAQDNGDYAGMQEANNAANMTRRQLGGYTAGSDGKTITLYNDPKLNTEIKTQKPEDYVSKYKNKIDSLYNTIANSKFEYDVNSDPSYQAYKAAYVRDGNRAMQDTLGEALGSSGFAGSSYANTAATQANDYYMSQLNDKVPELYQQAYARYQDELANQNQNLNTLLNLENNDYSRYRDTISDYNNDRNFEWNQNQAQYAVEQYNSEQMKNDARYEAESLANTKATQAAQELAQRQAADAKEQQQYENLIELAKLTGYGYNPYSGEVFTTLDYNNSMGYDQFGNPTLDYRKYQSDDYNTKWGLQNDSNKISNDYNLGLINANNDATKIANDYKIGSTNAATNRLKTTNEASNTTYKNAIAALDNVVENNTYSTLDMNGKQIKKYKYTDTEIKEKQANIIKNLYDVGEITANQVASLVSLYDLGDLEIKKGGR